MDLRFAFQKVVMHPKAGLVSVGAAGFALGGAIGYFVGKKRGAHTTVYRVEQDIMEPYVNQAARYGDPAKVVIPVEDLPTKDDTPMTTVRSGAPEEEKETIAYHKMGEVTIEQDETGLRIRPNTEPPPDEELAAAAEAQAEVIRQSIFAGADTDDWDWDEEKAGRTNHRPYILHEDEFHEDEMGFSQVACIYYAGDNVLTVAETNEVIMNHERIVGPLEFGHGSGDPGVVYIRNEARHAEYEVFRDGGKYEQEVLDLHADQMLQHEERQARRTPRRMPRE